MKKFPLSWIVCLSLFFSSSIAWAQGAKSIAPARRASGAQGVNGTQSPKHTFSLGDSTFLLDGKPLQMISGEMHYTRVPRAYWRDRMKMARAMGLNTIGTYVFWNAHEVERGKYDFSGNNDIAEFVRIAKEEGLWVVLRPSPYVCAEWEFGGYPWWLLKDSTVTVRSKDPKFIEAYRNYVLQVGKQLSPLLVTHGGNILMVQIENEYGSYSNDKSYLDLNQRIFREAGFDGLLFTCDGADKMGDGHLPGYLPAVNGEENPASVKAVINKYHEGKGPYYVAEWYPGWFDDWGKPHAHVDSKRAAATLDKILSAGISINIYLFHGGSTRGFMNGANMNKRAPYSPQVSSYDYDSPLDEAGNPTDKYFAFRDVIAKHLPAGQTLPPVPERSKTMAISGIKLTGYAGVFENLPAPVRSPTPLCFEDLNQAYGFVLYRTRLADAADGWLRLNELRDYAIVYVDGKQVGTLDRRLKQDSLRLEHVPAGARLEIWVENMGRINYGPFLTDNRQGITKSVTLGGSELRGWEMYGFPFNKVGAVKWGAIQAGNGPGLYKGTFTVNETKDTYIDMRGFGKGIVFLNGINLGRYWEIGPQQTLYVPAGWLKKGVNEVVVLDELKGGHKTLNTIATPVLDQLLHPVATQRTDGRYPIIPYPVSLNPAEGEFVVGPATTLVVDARFKSEGEILNSYFAKPLATGKTADIMLKYDNNIKEEEGYELVISPKHMVLSARTPAGAFMGVQTIRQLLPVGTGEVRLPALTIKDAPTYGWRGMHLDVSRHFFSMDYLRRFVDIMALYKLNTFHLHLTDDQGWRIEIKKYPLLTQNGAWRTFNNQDSACMKRAVDNPDFVIDPSHIIQKDGKTLYGGFYTQEEMRGLVAYAAARHITIIPEIDMPGHMMAAINQYNYLSCDGTSVFGKLFSTPICPCLPTTFQFAQDVYSEIMDIFPSQYIHIGGDEVDRSLWAKSPECKALMEKEGLKTTAELQSYFIRKMEQFFNSKGRKLIGWDEILEGGISKTAMVMYWRTWVPKAPSEAAKNGNAVVMTPGNPLYFDATPDRNSLPAVYNFNPIPKGLTDAEARNIIGAQANIWTEYIPTERRADYMYMPRMTAMAEILWTPQRDYASYLRRLRSSYGRLDALGVHYRLPDLNGFLSLNAFTNKDTLWIRKPLDGLTIRYSMDSTAPTAASPVLSAPLVIGESKKLRVAAFRPDGSRGDVYDLQYQKQTLAEPASAAGLSEGLVCSQFKGHFRMTGRMADRKVDTVMTVGGIVVPPALEAPSFGLQYRGYLDVPQDGVYSFYLMCDDGGILRIADREVVNNDGNHAPFEKNGQVALKKGPQKFALDFIEGGGGYVLQLRYSFNGSEPKEVPAQWFKH
ncbi:MAG: family 20 glycosylhydrolase [Bacteroidetes bacterium]|nr:family 20 glycosylhydrolase [Bacteroidota bacterium]